MFWCLNLRILTVNTRALFLCYGDASPARRALWCPAGEYRRPGRERFPGGEQQQGCQPRCCDWPSTSPCRQSPAKLPEPLLPQSRCCRCSAGRRRPLKWRACGSKSCRTQGWSGGPETPGPGWLRAHRKGAHWAAACSGRPGRPRCVRGKGSPRDPPPPPLLLLVSPRPQCLLYPGAAFLLSHRPLTTSSTSLPPSRQAQPPPVYPSCRLSVCLSESRRHRLLISFFCGQKSERNIDWLRDKSATWALVAATHF